MEYKIYKLVTNGNDGGETIKRVLEVKRFEYESFDSIEDAYEQIKLRGDDYCNYTVLPYIVISPFKL